MKFDAMLPLAWQWLQHNPHIIASVTCGLLVVIGTSTYMVGIWRRSVTPSGPAWVIRSLLCVVSFAAQVTEGASLSLALTGAQLACGVTITLLAFVRTGASTLRNSELCPVIGIGAVCAYGWLGTRSAVWFICGVILVDYIATYINVRNMVAKKAAESLFFWLCCLGAASAGVVSVGELHVAVLLAPAASLLNAIVMIVATSGVLVWRRRTAHVQKAVATVLRRRTARVPGVMPRYELLRLTRSQPPAPGVYRSGGAPRKPRTLRVMAPCPQAQKASVA